MATYDPSAFTHLLESAIDSSSAAQTVEQITAFAAQTFETPHAGVTLIHDRGRRFETAGPTNDVVRQADDLQGDLIEGPCVEAASQSRTVVSNHVKSDPRWPHWGPRVAELGLQSVLSSEIHAGGRRVGALNVYGNAAREFTREDFETAQVLASHAAVAMRFSKALEGLTTALDSRTLIGQAQGVLMHKYQIGPDRAFAILKRLSQDENIRLVLIAERVIDDATDS